MSGSISCTDHFCENKATWIGCVLPLLPLLTIKTVRVKQPPPPPPQLQRNLTINANSRTKQCVQTLDNYRLSNKMLLQHHYSQKLFLWFLCETKAVLRQVFCSLHSLTLSISCSRGKERTCEPTTGAQVLSVKTLRKNGSLSPWRITMLAIWITGSLSASGKMPETHTQNTPSS